MRPAWRATGDSCDVSDGFSDEKTRVLITNGLGKPAAVARGLQFQWRMKTNTKSLGKVFSFVIAGVCLAPLAGLAAGADASAVSSEAVKAESSVVTGRVTATSDNSLTVNGDVIAVSGATAFIKEAAAIGLRDVKAGDDVRIAVTKNADGTLQALSVEVVKAAE